MGETRQRKVDGKLASKKKETTVNTEGDKSEQTDGETKSAKKSKVAILKENQTKGFSRYLSTIAKIVLAVLIIPPFLNYAALQKEIAELKPEGEFYDIGWGQKLFLSCRGKGPPTVIFDAPTGMNSDVWSLVTDKTAMYSRVCVYDRAGIGFSDRPFKNYTEADGTDGKSNHRNRWEQFTAERMVDDLHQLITRSSDQPKPFLFVGAELGSLLAQFYTRLFESDVMGLILINPLSDDLFLQDSGIWAQNWFGHMLPSYQTIQLGAALGLTRFAIMLGLLQHPLYMAAGVSEETVKRQKHLLCHPKHLSSVVDEYHFMNETFSQFRTIKTLKSLPESLPVTVITGNYYDEQMPGPLNKAWAKSEQNLINSLYPQCQHIVVNGGDRHMMYKNPEAIIEPIRKAVKHWKNKNTNSKDS